MTSTVTNKFGHKFYIEQSADFDDDGRMIAGRGWFAGLVKGNDSLGGIFFETKEAALDAIATYEG
jgi:hypothetical protein